MDREHAEQWRDHCVLFHLSRTFNFDHGVGGNNDQHQLYDHRMAASTTYYFYVTAQDSVGNVSASSSIASTTTKQVLLPSIPYYFRVANDHRAGKHLDIELDSGKRRFHYAFHQPDDRYGNRDEHDDAGTCGYHALHTDCDEFEWIDRRDDDGLCSDRADHAG